MRICVFRKSGRHTVRASEVQVIFSTSIKLQVVTVEIIYLSAERPHRCSLLDISVVRSIIFTEMSSDAGCNRTLKSVTDAAEIGVRKRLKHAIKFSQ